MPYSQKIAILKQKLTFGPKFPNFTGQYWAFLSLAAVQAAAVNVFNTKEASHWFPDMRVPKVLLHPPQNLISMKLLPDLPKMPKTGPMPD